MNLEELLKYCQICNSETITKQNKVFLEYWCTNENCRSCSDSYAAIENHEVIYINDGSNHGTFTIFIKKNIREYYLLIKNKELYFDSIDSLIKGYVSYRKNKIFY